jgi:hypothetical protein
MNDGVICVIRRLDGYKFYPSCLIGLTNGLTPERD